MVYGLAKQSGGHVRLYSEVGRGTSAKVCLPRHFGSVEEAAAASLPETAHRAGPAETILVVEDEDNVRRMSVAVLQEPGYTVHAAASGEEALHRLPAQALLVRRARAEDARRPRQLTQ